MIVILFLIFYPFRWSYGILLWEIMSFGEQPYPNIYSADDLNIFLRRDQRLEKPRRCSNNM